MQTESARSRIVALDKRRVWHPYTEMSRYRDGPDPLVIVRAEGSRLFDADGRGYLDGNASWWSSTLGHAHPRLLAALRRQSESLAHTALAGITHEPAAELAEALCRVAPAGLEHVFFSDDGSTAVEVALKLSLQYWAQNGRPGRRSFVALEDAFHGETLGATAIGGVEAFRKPFEGALLECSFVAPPREPGSTPRAVEALARILGAHAGAIAAVVVEPVLQGAAGMRSYDPAFLTAARELCDRHDVFLIFDEVFTGYGRSGPMWAAQHAGVSPDLLCTAKGFTGGLLPMGATLATPRIFEGFLGLPARAFYYGHTFCGHPLGAAVALEVLRDLRGGEDPRAREAQGRAHRRRLRGHARPARRRAHALARHGGRPRPRRRRGLSRAHGLARLRGGAAPRRLSAAARKRRLRDSFPQHPRCGSRRSSSRSCARASRPRQERLELTPQILREETKDGVRTLTFDRPEARNAFNAQLYRALKQALDRAADDDLVKVVILTGAGDAFTAGQDLAEMAQPAAGATGGEHPFGACLDRVISFDKPLLAAVNGVGVGLGLTILLHCDVVYIAKGARLRVPFVSLGVVPEAASSYLLPLRVGHQAAAEILFTADWVSSERAVEIGLAARELPREQLLPELHALAARIAQHPIGSLRHTKRLVRACDVDAIRAARAREDAGLPRADRLAREPGGDPQLLREAAVASRLLPERSRQSGSICQVRPRSVLATRTPRSLVSAFERTRKDTLPSGFTTISSKLASRSPRKSSLRQSTVPAGLQ